MLRAQTEAAIESMRLGKLQGLSRANSLLNGDVFDHFRPLGNNVEDRDVTPKQHMTTALRRDKERGDRPVTIYSGWDGVGIVPPSDLATADGKVKMKTVNEGPLKIQPAPAWASMRRVSEYEGFEMAGPAAGPGFITPGVGCGICNSAVGDELWIGKQNLVYCSPCWETCHNELLHTKSQNGAGDVEDLSFVGSAGHSQRRDSIYEGFGSSRFESRECSSFEATISERCEWL